MPDISTPSPNPFFIEAAPCEQAVDLTEVLNMTSSYIRRKVVMDEMMANAASLWVGHTHLIDCFDISPIACINAPERACGKSLFQNVLSRLSRRPLSSANASVSAMFRVIEMHQPTLFVDEADTFFRDNFDLQGMFNAGHERGGYILRSEQIGNSFEPKQFSVFSAKCIAGIALQTHLPDSTMSRCIVFNMRRKLPHEKTERFRRSDHDEADLLSSQWARVAIDYKDSIAKADPVLPDSLDDRTQDNWEPLFKIAAATGDDWLTKAREASLAMSERPSIARVSGNDLLRDIHDVFVSSGNNRISTAQLIDSLSDDEEKPWAQFNRGKTINPRQIAQMLAPYGISSKTVRLGPHSTPKGYEISQFEDAFERYLSVIRQDTPDQQDAPKQQNMTNQPTIPSILDQLEEMGLATKSEE